MKTYIWELASKQGPRPEVILRDLNRLTYEDQPLEGELVPDRRTIRRVIDEIQTLDIEILSTLPRHIWPLRKDYRDIKGELGRIASGVDQKELDRRIRWEQAKHIRELQELARSARESAKQIPYPQDTVSLDPIYLLFLELIYKLTHDALWPSLAAHLGTKAQEFEIMASELEGTPLKQRSLEHRRARVAKAKRLLLCSELFTVALYGETKEWEDQGLSQRCPWCPIQTYEPINITPDD